MDRYTDHGYLRTPTLLWLGWLFLARAWLVFIVAGASFDEGGKILEFVYPDSRLMIIGMVIGVPALIFMWLIALRNQERKVVNVIVSHAKPVTMVMIALQATQTFYHIYLARGAFSWSLGLTLVGLLWFGLYLIKSQTVRDCLLRNGFEIERHQ